MPDGRPTSAKAPGRYSGTSRVSAYKVRQVLDLIRGQDVDRAAETLSLGDREAPITVGKVLASAVANAVHNDGLDAEELYVSACYADEGSTLKRWRPRARGRATRIRKRTSHITIIVSRLPDERIARRRARPTPTPHSALAGSQDRVVAGRPRRLTETTELDTGSEAWSEDAVMADDVITETEAGRSRSPTWTTRSTEDDPRGRRDVVTETEADPTPESDSRLGRR